ncbi:tripartite tricarboxylate transporter substrate binding protein [Lampropedia puyangensis]|uniref:Tripartite tricarboxylate transporter substrate binding protein n=1 Tax=Lampropedia puyangensis TaxID=1330072 RepID=A0A4S8FBG1_9BURK|nr:tripartite tricarboxylate transporter substrate binding protein [Lampropedia puyangensis]THU04549.1 tripartite tricarboxylate transporter substrate binding protein [Lampropedia puyangensis]
MIAFHPRTLVFAAASFVLACGQAQAESSYPNRPIKLIVPYAAGGTVDVFARVISPGLEEKLKQPIVVENVPGAGGAIGVNKGVKSPADGYTIVMGIVSDVVLAPLTESAVTYTYKDLEAIGPLGTSGLAVVANPSIGINSFSSLITYAKANPGKLSYGATGAGSLPAVAMESLKRRTGIDIEFIPYTSASKIALDLMGGHLDIALSGLPALLEPIKSGKMMAIGVMSKERDIGSPEIGSAGETPELGGMDFYFWTGLFAPKGTAPAIVSKINEAFAEVLQEEDVRIRFKDYGVKISEPMTPAQFADFVAKSNADWEAVIKSQ